LNYQTLIPSKCRRNAIPSIYCGQGAVGASIFIDGEMEMETSAYSPRRATLSARRIVLLATVAGLGATGLFAGTTFSGPSILPGISTAIADTQQRPVGFGDLVEKVKPAVVSVHVKMQEGPEMMGFDGGRDMPNVEPGSPAERFFRRFGQPQDMQPSRPNRHFAMGQGSGFFITADGYAITNNHVVEKAGEVEVKTDDGKTYSAKVIGTDPKTDLALIKVEGRSDFPFVKLAEKTPRIGDWVVAVGNPFGLDGSVTAGIVSARGRDIGAGPYDDFIQIDAPVNKGNSGGPSFDVNGNVIGVNTAIFSPSGGSVGIAFAIPADTVKTVVAQLRDKGAVTRGWIGVQIQPVTDEMTESLGLKTAEGALVAEVQPNSPAAKAGMASGDVITSVNGQQVKDAHELVRMIGAMAPQSSAKLTVMRKGKEQPVSVTLGELPKERQAQAAPAEQKKAEKAPLGLTLAPAGSVAGAGTEGVVVAEVRPDGPAAERGMKAGDVILDVGGTLVSTPADVKKVLGEARAANKSNVLMRIKSGDATRFVVLPTGNA
jgi:serine protease Do